MEEVVAGAEATIDWDLGVAVHSHNHDNNKQGPYDKEAGDEVDSDLYGEDDHCCGGEILVCQGGIQDCARL